MKQHYNDCEIDQLVMFCNCELQKKIVRDDYHELIKLSIIFLGGDKDKKLKIRPPGAMHEARWMARAIYSLKICLLQSHFNICMEEKQALRDVCLFIATVYVKPWVGCRFPVKAPYQDLCFLKTLKGYKKVDKVISQAAFSKFCQLWYLPEEIAALSLFNGAVDEETKMKKKLFARFSINTNFLSKNPTTWNDDPGYKNGLEKLQKTVVVNDVADRGVKLIQEYNNILTHKM